MGNALKIKGFQIMDNFMGQGQVDMVILPIKLALNYLMLFSDIKHTLYLKGTYLRIQKLFNFIKNGFMLLKNKEQL